MEGPPLCFPDLHKTLAHWEVALPLLGDLEQGNMLLIGFYDFIFNVVMLSGVEVDTLKQSNGRRRVALLFLNSEYLLFMILWAAVNTGSVEVIFT